MHEPIGTSPVLLNQNSQLAIDDVAHVSRNHAVVEFEDEAALKNHLGLSCKCIHDLACGEERETIYGVNTGFGAMSGVRIKSVDDMRALQANLIWFLKAGAGGTIPISDVRGAMLLRLRSFLNGASGARWELASRLQRFLNEGVTPVVREFGSIGASGDLVPLASIAGALIGLDKCFQVDVGFENPQRETAVAALERLGLKPLILEPKEGLALVNGTSVSTAIAANALHESRILFACALGVHALMVQALHGFVESFNPYIHRVKNHPGQRWVAEQLRRLLTGSKLVSRGPNRKKQAPKENLALSRIMFRMSTGFGEPDDNAQFHSLLNSLRKKLRGDDVDSQADSVLALMKELVARIDEVRDSTEYEHWDAEPIQDRYSIRCLPQFLGPVVDGLTTIVRQIETEMNSANDNPLIETERNRVHHGGNFLAQYTAVGMDQLRYHLGMIAKHLDVQIALLVEPQFSGDLAPSLVGNHHRETNSGLKGLQISGNSIVPILEFLGNPIALRFPTHAEQFNQNINSQAFASANLARQSVSTFRHYVAITLMFAVQGVDLRSRIASGSYDARNLLSLPSRDLYTAVRDVVGAPIREDRPYVYNDHEQALDEHIQAIAEDLDQCERGRIAAAIVPTLEQLKAYDLKYSSRT